MPEQVAVRVPPFEAISHLTRRIAAHGKASEALVDVLSLSYEPALAMILECLGSGGTVLACGNGGSYAQACHLAAELAVRYDTDRRALAAIALPGDPVALTACANDYGYDRVFERALWAFGKPADVLVPFSTSGTSRNVLNAISTAKGLGMKTLGISGRRGFGLACDLDIVAPGETTALVQEMHLLIVHLLMEGIERHVQAQPRPTL